MSSERTLQWRAQFVAEGSDGPCFVRVSSSFSTKMWKNENYEGGNRKQKPFKGDDVKHTYVTPWQMGYEIETLSVQRIILI